LPNAAVAAVAPTLGPNASLRAIRQKREMETRGDQDNQDKSDLQGKIKFYQQFCASQQNFAIAERKTQRNVTVGHSQQPAPGGNETAATVATTRVTNPCQFSTFKSSMPGSRTAVVSPLPSQSQTDAAASLDLSGLNLGHSSRLELGPNRIAELNPATTSRDYYQPISRTRERSPNVASRQLDKQSYFFHGHKTEKDIDREVVMFEDLEAEDSSCTRRVDEADDAAATSGGSMNCFSSPNKERGCTTDYGDSDKKMKYPALAGAQSLAYETRRDSENVEFLEKEGEIFKKSSSELLQEATGSKRRNFSFRNKEKIHRSLESLERSIDLPAADCKSLDLLPEKRPKTFFHGKQRSLDSSQKLTKKSVDSAANKPRKRPNFFQRVGRSLHLLPKEREKHQDLLKREEQPTDNRYPQTDQEKCEYFLQKHQKDADFFEQTPSALTGRATPAYLGSFNEVDAGVALNSTGDYFGNVQLEESTFRVTGDMNNISKMNIVDENAEPSIQSDGNANNIEQSRLLDPVASIATQETMSGNKDSLEIGYSISQLGRLYLQNLQHVGRPDGLQSAENAADAEKLECYIEWIARNDLDALSHGTNSSDSLAHGKPQGNLDILKGILLDIFVCIC